MSRARDRFKKWYVNVLKDLYQNADDAGFAIVLITFPLLERYLKHLSGLAPGQPALSSDRFKQNLLDIFPELQSEGDAENFWKVYRNNLLHTVGFEANDDKGRSIPLGGLRQGGDVITIDKNGDFWLVPILFSERVVQTIEGDFDTFRKARPALPAVIPLPGDPSGKGTTTTT